jgi:glucose-1-phosphate adenylyltransferase
VILNHTIISEKVTIERCIIDKRVTIGRNTHLGIGDNIANKEKPDLLSSGITVIEKGAVIPNDIEIGKNCRIFKSATFSGITHVSSGETLR